MSSRLKRGSFHDGHHESAVVSEVHLGLGDVLLVKVEASLASAAVV